MTSSIQTARPRSDTLEISRSPASSLGPERHELSSRRLEREYADAPITPGGRARIAAELDHVGLDILSDPCHEPLVVVKRSAHPPPGTPAARATRPGA